MLCYLLLFLQAWGQSSIGLQKVSSTSSQTKGRLLSSLLSLCYYASIRGPPGSVFITQGQDLKSLKNHIITIKNKPKSPNLNKKTLGEIIMHLSAQSAQITGSLTLFSLKSEISKKSGLRGAAKALPVVNNQKAPYRYKNGKIPY